MKLVVTGGSRNTQFFLTFRYLSVYSSACFMYVRVRDR